MPSKLNSTETTENPPEACAELLKELNRFREKLTDIGNRNPLIHVKLDATRAKALTIINERTEDIFNILYKSEKTMRFIATGSDDPADADENGVIFEIEDDDPPDEKRYKDNNLETPLGVDSLKKRLLALERATRTDKEERGINTLYLALGFLRWKAPAPSRLERTSPLILLPVALERLKNGAFKISRRDENIATNLPLQARLKDDFGIKFPDIPESIEDSWSPIQYFDEVQQIISDKNWAIEPDTMRLRNFNFAKFLMWRDLDPENWTKNGACSKNSLLGSLLRPQASKNGEQISSLFPEDQPIDTVMSASQATQVIEADISQLKVIEEVRAGNSLTVQGPPGTGKSQTITNILAAAAHDGKTVLFMAEKMAALEVVHNKMKQLNLDNLCLELHSHKSNKRLFLENLDETIKKAKMSAPDEPDIFISETQPTPRNNKNIAYELNKLQKNLNKITDTLHSPLEKIENPTQEDTPYHIISELTGLRNTKGQYPLGVTFLKYINAELKKNYKDKLEEMIKVLKSTKYYPTKNPFEDHPLKCLRNIKIQDTRIESLRENLRMSIITFDTAYQKELSELDKNMENAEKYWNFLYPSIRRKQKQLEAIFGKKIALKEIQAYVKNLKKQYKKRTILPAPSHKHNDVASFDDLIKELDYESENTYSRQQTSLSLSHFRLREEFAILYSELTQKKYNEWVKISRCKNQLSTFDKDINLFDNVIDGTLDTHGFSKICAENNWNNAVKQRPALNELQYEDRHQLVELFRHCDIEWRDIIKNKILETHAYKTAKIKSTADIHYIQTQNGRKRGHAPIRKIITQTRKNIQTIKPIFLMSPISITQFLPPGDVEFDILVIDEASQVRPEDAMGAILRAKQIVVVGDSKQLPPTSFFHRYHEMDGDDDDDNDKEQSSAGVESILKLCDAQGLRTKMLEWHYRSRDPSLMYVSNAEFYDDRLVFPPSPLRHDDNYGLKFKRIDGTYVTKESGKGRHRTNYAEAEKIVNAAIEHIHHTPGLSLGIVSFSKEQQNLIYEIFAMRQTKNNALNNFLDENKKEHLFVKNIENVQGDERDVIFISTCYGPSEKGGRLIDMRAFGPINNEGGARRLNVLFTRARCKCVVFASFDPADIRADGNEGRAVLKKFLQFAQTGEMPGSGKTNTRDYDSDFEIDVAREVKKLGYHVDPQVGASGFFIDLGVSTLDNLDNYILAIECDGATYHSAPSARMRDIIRQGILENQGWRFHRIWSTDWQFSRKSELKRLNKALEAATKDAKTSKQKINRETIVDK